MKKFSCSTKSVMCFLKKEKNKKILTSTTAATTAINDKLLQNSLIQYLARSRKKLVFTFVYRNCLFFHKIVLYSTNTKKRKRHRTNVVPTTDKSFVLNDQNTNIREHFQRHLLQTSLYGFCC